MIGLGGAKRRLAWCSVVERHLVSVDEGAAVEASFDVSHVFCEVFKIVVYVPLQFVDALFDFDDALFHLSVGLAHPCELFLDSFYPFESVGGFLQFDFFGEFDAFVRRFGDSWRDLCSGCVFVCFPRLDEALVFEFVESVADVLVVVGPREGVSDAAGGDGSFAAVGVVVELCEDFDVSSSEIFDFVILHLCLVIGVVGGKVPAD